ncbi:MAG TPA: hypothetical protein VFG20_11695 [Planctomycetaceae bacterium]|jgi:hypothetical protein|nr:hypothetical protein [Planctomycetaceae bacterium]
MVKTMQGVIRGKSVELIGEVGLPEGTPVEVVLRDPAEVRRKRIQEIVERNPGIATWWTEEDDRILAEIEADRRRATFRELPE